MAAIGEHGPGAPAAVLDDAARCWLLEFNPAQMKGARLRQRPSSRSFLEPDEVAWLLRAVGDSLFPARTGRRPGADGQAMAQLGHTKARRRSPSARSMYAQVVTRQRTDRTLPWVAKAARR